MSENKLIYSKKSIEFATVVAETCLFLERVTEFTKSDFISKATKLLPLLYLKIWMRSQTGFWNVL